MRRRSGAPTETPSRLNTLGIMGNMEATKCIAEIAFLNVERMLT
jgi:hypothetical protein